MIWSCLSEQTFYQETIKQSCVFYSEWGWMFRSWTDSGRDVCVWVSQSCPTLATRWTIAHRAPLSMEFSRQEYWSRLPFLSPGDLPNPGIEAGSPALQVDSLVSVPPWKPLCLKGSPSCLLLFWGSLRSTSVSDHNSFHVTSSVLGLTVCEVLCATFRDRLFIPTALWQYKSLIVIVTGN